ncbi:(d)CMP kinase [Tunturiibacter gelidoferens]|uniref:Cytidylate kinase n=3 Tax=Tunturiibacter TaxID=3154218 RepID=A0A7Y9NQE8_9BACT|nr:(d)CMP kinase [Edaphobacter lichenicola]MBB5337711.1 cytidylate kinase [Edaphobacter lichenicola]NYF53000.1 cytidylate kinase [Edaphobacter lichenicola]
MTQPHEDSAPATQPETKKRQRPVIAIDGPAGAGKSTLAAHLARRFGFLNLETGAMYRALALKAIENDYDFDEEAPLMELAAHTRITLEPQLEGNRVLLDGMDVSRRIRETDVTNAASKISVHPQLRAWMVQQQRALGEAGGVVMEGRDIGTAVFPDAEVKIFLDAAPEVRGSRRYRQAAPGSDSVGPTVRQNSARQAPDPVTAEQQRLSEEAVLRELKDRDYRDRNRAESPLRAAADAVILDSTSMTLDEVLNQAEEIVRTHLKA